MRSICSVEGCKATSVAKNLCDRHYRLFRKYGHTNNMKNIQLLCSFCTKQFEISVPLSHSKYSKFCSNKCKTDSIKKRSPLCKLEGCENKSHQLRGGFCQKHQERFLKYGDPTIVKKLNKYPENVVCKVEGCKNKVLANFMCSKHYQMWKEHGDPKGGRYEYKIRKAITHSDGTRTCSECEKRLPIKSFHKDKNASDGYRSKCKKCRLTMVNKWYFKDAAKRRKVASDARKKDPEKLRKRDMERYEKDREKRIALATEHSHLRKARKKNTKTERGISKLALKKKFGTKCYYCGKEMDFSVGAGRKFNRDMATIEHLIPLARGGEHTFENTVLACRHCNISKNAKSEAEFEEYKKI